MVRTILLVSAARAASGPPRSPQAGLMCRFAMSILAILPGLTIAASGRALEADEFSPRVQFDLTAQSAARDVTPVAFATSNSQERLIAVRLPVSVISRLREGEQLDEVWIRVESPDESLRVEDFAPRTTLSTSVHGTLRMEGSADRQKEFALQLRGQSPGLAEGTLTALDREQARLQYEFEVLPPLELGVASGTLRRGQGVYFKFRSGPRAALEGELAVEAVFRVADGWRGDRLYVHCEAAGSATGFPGLGNEKVRLGAKSFVVALYRDGDAAALRIARQYLDAESDYRDAIGRWTGKRGSSGNPLAQISAALLAATSPSSRNASASPTREAKAGVLESVVYARGTAGRRSLPDVPGELRDATTHFVASQRQLDRLSAPPIGRLPAVPEKEAPPPMANARMPGAAGPAQVPTGTIGASFTSARDSAPPHSGERSRGPR
ncbi:MAG: hypothetical protein FJ295_20935 [Planctomycetes bacterium]|nr:hypothetical protein [Planctomycetota bacterium]